MVVTGDQISRRRDHDRQLFSNDLLQLSWLVSPRPPTTVRPPNFYISFSSQHTRQELPCTKSQSCETLLSVSLRIHPERRAPAEKQITAQLPPHDYFHQFQAP